MDLQDISTRVVRYGKQHGFLGTLRRLALSFSRCFTGSRMALYYCDLGVCRSPALEDPGRARVEEKRAQTELDPEDLRRILNVAAPRIVQRHLAERFAQGASLWLCKVEDQLAGYGWSIEGRTIEPHYFPLGAKDVHFFDFYVFPEHRGRRINPWLVGQMLSRLAVEPGHRAFIEAAEWNIAQLSSLGRTPFRPFGMARKFRLFGRTVVLWSGQPTRP